MSHLMSVTTSDHPMTLAQLRDFLRDHLVDDIMAFWMRHGIDPAGGLNTCIQDNGAPVSRDKWLWSQWRAVWVFSRLYRTIEARPEWLETAWHIYRFASRYGWDDQTPGWMLTLNYDGRVINGCDSIYVDAFAIYGLTELGLATGDAQVLALARKTADCALERLKLPHEQIPHFPYLIPRGARVHGIPMMFSMVLWELGQAVNDDHYRQAAIGFQEEVFTQFYRPGRDVMLERVAEDGSEYPSPEGTAVVPGHVIEDMWFQIHIARDRGDDALVRKSIDIMRRHTELGWDHQQGGLTHAIDADGGDEIAWPAPHGKIWWVQTEAMYGLLLAHKMCGESWCMDWYWRVHEVAFAHYPVPGHGEWRQKLGRRFEPLGWAPLPVKDPFHLPRALMLSVEILSDE